MNDKTKVWAAVERLHAAGVPIATGGSKNSEKVALEAYLDLSPRDKSIVDSWRDLGNSWADSLVNSGVLTTTRRTKPEDYARWSERDKAAQVLAERQTAAARKESCEHEAAHCVVAQSFGLRVGFANVLPDGSGNCSYEAAATPFQTAAIAFAGQTWINAFRSYEFPCGAKGCEKDLQKIRDLYVDGAVLIEDVHRYTYHALETRRDAVLAVASLLDRDGQYRQ